MNRLDSMQIFLRIAELASFTRAAEQLAMPKASMSNAVRELETLLGTQLLRRTTRKVEMTHDGRLFYERCKTVLDDLDQLQTMFRDEPQEVRGRLRVDMPSRLARNLIMPHLPALFERHPQLELELGCSDRRVDLVREGFDCVVRVGTLHETNLVAKRLGRLRLINCASPAYLSKHGTPRTLADLSSHFLIHYSPTLGAKPDGWEYREGGRYRSLPMRGALAVNDGDAYEAACIAGLGLIQVPAIGVQPLLATKQLVEVLPQHQAEPMPVSILYAQRRNLPQRVKLFMAWLAERLQPHLV